MRTSQVNGWRAIRWERLFAARTLPAAIVPSGKSDNFGVFFMPKLARAASLSLLGLFIGCGGPPSLSDGGPPPAHGGNLIALPGGQGYVEVVQKDGTAGKSMSAEASFYFLKDGTTPMSPAPSAGTLTVGKNTVTLKPSGDALVTPDGPPLFPKGVVDGRLSVQIDGKTTVIPLGMR
jgi:hypothetical protein